ncbi:MAG: NAD(P)/FAD-dependent oxidoreductase [Spirochaetia bacterium]
MASSMYDLIIMGAGPAGLAASVYATRKRLDFLVLSRDLGGKANYSIKLPQMEEHRVIRARELVIGYKSRLEHQRSSYRLEGVKSVSHNDGIFAVTTDKGATDESSSILVATGAKNRRLDVPGEARFLSRGLGHSAISYSHLFNGRRVFLTGDTDRVLHSALELSIQANSVVLLFLKDGSYTQNLMDLVKSLDRVEVIVDGSVTEFLGGEYATEAVISTPDGERTISADGFFVEPEPQGNTEFLEGLVEFHGAGYIPVDADSMTTVPGLFAAGDVTGYSYPQVLVALGDGAKAVLSAYNYLLDNGLGTR